jgi:hypothetical protein
VSDALDENWRLFLDLLPMGWQEQAVLSGALERLRGFESAADLLRVLLLHVGKGYSLREAAARAQQAGLTSVSAVALFKRLRKADDWWRQLCVKLLDERGWTMTADSRGYRVRVLDATVVTEPGPKGALWRIHYSLQLPSLECDHLELTPGSGSGTGEKLSRFPAAPGDLILADRAFCNPSEVTALSAQGAALAVRLNTSSLPLWEPGCADRFALLDRLAEVPVAGAAVEWPVEVRSGARTAAGRLCIVRKNELAADKARRRIRRRAQQGGPKTRPETLQYAAYVMVFTTLPSGEFTAAEVLEWYRLRWQIELHFKRLKSLAGIGRLPKHDPRSARAWLYGKLLMALLGDKLMRIARDISPWGYDIRQAARTQRVASIQLPH